MTRLFFPAFIAILTFSACTTDFELEAPWKDLPVVYAFINMQDTAHYVRVEKAFLQPGGNANAIAQIADSLYYDASVIVQLEKKATGQRYTLQRVDGNLEGYPREEGPFAQAPNYLYKIKASDINLSAEQELRLIINRGGGLPAVTADAIVLGPMAPRFNVPGSPLNLDYNRTISFLWDVPPSAAVFDLRMRIHYREFEPGNPGSNVFKSLDWILGRELTKAQPNATSIRYDDIRGEDFFRFVGANMAAASNRQRELLGVDIYYTAGGEAFADLIRVQRANTGITSSQAVPVYSNLSEGRGVFTSRTTAERLGLPLTGASADSLRTGIYTRQLNFQ
jgi:hypothetical protein